jgi:hypothetical protein
VAEELVPFGVGGGAVLFARPGGPALGDEGPVPADGFLAVDGLWPMVVLMSWWPRRIWAMWGGMPLRKLASVVKILRESWGLKMRGLPSVPVIPAPVRVVVRRSRMLPMAMGRFSRSAVPLEQRNSVYRSAISQRTWSRAGIGSGSPYE